MWKVLCVCTMVASILLTQMSAQAVDHQTSTEGRQKTGLAGTSETTGNPGISLIEKVLIAEGASEGFDGLYAIACVMRNRRWNLNGFSGARRRNLDDFVRRQPLQVRNDAQRIVHKVRRGTTDTTLGATHYENVEAFGVPWWAEGQDPVFKIGRHTFWKLP